MSGQSLSNMQTPGQRVLVNVLPLVLIFFLILTAMFPPVTNLPRILTPRFFWFRCFFWRFTASAL